MIGTGSAAAVRLLEDGVIEVHHKHLRISDAERLRAILGQAPTGDG